MYWLHSLEINNIIHIVESHICARSIAGAAAAAASLFGADRRDMA